MRLSRLRQSQQNARREFERSLQMAQPMAQQMDGALQRASPPQMTQPFWQQGRQSAGELFWPNYN